MKVSFVVFGDGVVDDVGDIIHVHPAGGNVGGDEDVFLSRLKRGHRPLSGVLTHVAVDTDSSKPAVGQLFGETLGGAFCPGKNDGFPSPLGLQDSTDHLVFVESVSAVDDVSNVRLGKCLVRVLGPDVKGFAHEPSGEGQNRTGHRGGKQHRLPGRRNLLEQSLDIGQKPEIQHFVGLIEHNDLNLGERQVSLLHQIQQTPRCSDDDLGALFELGNLALISFTPVDRDHLRGTVCGGNLDVFGHLNTQFPGGNNDECFHPRRRVVTQFLDEGERKAESFPGSGSGLPDDVLAGEGHGNGLFLNGERRVNACLVESFDHVRRDAEVRKIHEKLPYLDCCFRPQSSGVSLGCPRGAAGHYCGGVEWRWWKKKTPGRVLRVRTRRDADQVSRVDLTDLVPPAADYLAHLAATTLVLSHETSRVGAQAWSVVDQDAMARATQMLLSRYDRIHRLLSDYVADASEAMVAPLDQVKSQMSRMVADRWFERVATCYVVSGLMTDFYRTLAGGLPGPLGSEVKDILDADSEAPVLAEVLGRVLELDDAYVSRVSLWSRRLVGDILLIARGVLPRVGKSSASGDRFEPLFTDILLGHTTRLEKLGLTA